MKNTKKIIISFVISLCIVLSFQFVFNNLFKSDTETIYVLNKEVYKGEKITKEDLKSIIVSSKLNMKDSFNINYANKVAKENLSKGQVLSKDNISEKEELEETNERYEYVSIEIKNISQAVAYQLKKGDNINVYFTSRDILGENGSQSIVQNTKTIKILENKKIIGLYDTSGSEVIDNDVYNAIVLRVTDDEAANLSNIKEEGSFNISLVK